MSDLPACLVECVREIKDIKANMSTIHARSRQVEKELGKATQSWGKLGRAWESLGKLGKAGES